MMVGSKRVYNELGLSELLDEGENWSEEMQLVGNGDGAVSVAVAGMAEVR